MRRTYQGAQSQVKCLPIHNRKGKTQASTSRVIDLSPSSLNKKLWIGQARGVTVLWVDDFLPFRAWSDGDEDLITMERGTTSMCSTHGERATGKGPFFYSSLILLFYYFIYFLFFLNGWPSLPCRHTSTYTKTACRPLPVIICRLLLFCLVCLLAYLLRFLYLNIFGHPLPSFFNLLPSSLPSLIYYTENWTINWVKLPKPS